MGKIIKYIRKLFNIRRKVTLMYIDKQTHNPVFVQTKAPITYMKVYCKGEELPAIIVQKGVG